MNFLRPSKSQKRKAAKEDQHLTEQSGREIGHLAQREQRREVDIRPVQLQVPAAAPRPRTAGDNRLSFSRPRTAVREASERSHDLQVVNETIEIREGDSTFNFPTPSPRLTPQRTAAFQKFPSPLPGRQSPSHIGLALGSPREAPHWGNAYPMDRAVGGLDHRPSVEKSPLATGQAHQEGPKTELKRKKSGWATLSKLFRKGSKNTAPAPFYKVRVEPEAPNSANGNADYGMRSPDPSLGSPLPGPISPQPATISSHHARVPSVTRGMARLEARANADRVSLMPHAQYNTFNPPPSAYPSEQRVVIPHDQPLRSHPTRPSADMFKQIPDERNDSPLSIKTGSGAQAPHEMPRLDLDIPNGEMERYSVMFEKLLEPRVSILERRNSKMPRTKSNARGARNLKPLPLQPTQLMDVPVRNLPQRSVTSPHLTRDVPTSRTLKSDTTTAAAHPLHRSNTAPPSATSSIAPNFSRPKASAPTISSADTVSEPTTPTTLRAPSLYYDAPAIVEPDLEASYPLRQRRSVDSLDVPQGLYPRVKSPEDLERQIVNVSVARQVSVSRARRQVEHAVISRQPLRPRVVELGKNRKSTMVLIESGED